MTCRNCVFIDTCSRWHNEDYYFLHGCEEHTPVSTREELGKSVPEFDRAMKEFVGDANVY